MADQVGKCNMSNSLFLQNAFSVNAVKEEECQGDDYVDDKVEVFETTIITEVQDNLICDEIEQCGISTTLNNIKTELSLPEIQYDVIQDNIKIEMGINTDDIKIQFNNGLLFCEDCHAYYQDYCTKCGMLVHILNGAAPVNAAELPNKILKIQDYSGETHVFALKDIPVGVKFGPFTGLNRTERSWKIKGGKFVVNNNNSMNLNWMQYISSARNVSAQNLLVFQYGDNIYYRSTCRIQEGDELLVYFGEEYDDSLNRNVEMGFIPASEHTFKDAFACTFCCFGFSLKSYLAKHKAICSENVDGGFSIEELTQCPSCKINLDQKEYVMHHMAYCRKIGDRKSVLPITGDLTRKVNGHKTPQYQMYICQQCLHKTKYKESPKSHTNEHYEAKIYKCEICCGLFKTEGAPRAHMENTHIRTDGNQDRLSDSTGVYMNAHAKAEQSRSQDEMKQLKCSKCEFQTKYKRNIRRHMAEIHLKKCNYKCDSCDYKAHQQYQLKNHIEAKHLQEFKYKCDTCDYKTNRKANLERHVEARHLRVFKYKCDICDYKTNQRSRLKIHIDTWHLKEFKYKCDRCNYKTNRKSDLKSHIEAKHLNEFKYKCDKCDYKASIKWHLRVHIEASHLK